jgi:catechol 2,3-dioxygenase-like lactoylglutathione lyase family enzyme
MRLLGMVAASAVSLFAQVAPPNESGISMGHIHMMVADPEVHKKLWVGVMGAEVVHTGTLEMWKLPGIFLIVGKARTPPAEGTDGSTVNHFGVLVPSYPAIKAKMTELGLEFAMDNAANRQIIVKFPDKVAVEFSEDTTLKVPMAMHHIHLSTPNDEKLRDWYVKTFGAKPGMRRTFQAAFLPGGEVDFRKAAAAEAPSKGRSLDHIGFEVKNLEAFCKKLEADGVKFEGPVRDVPQIGLKIAFLVDPEGTRIELTEGLTAVH